MEILTINTIALTNLKNAEHVQFHTNVRNVIESAGTEETGITDLVYDPYCVTIEKEQDIVNMATGSAFTIEMQEYDQKRDLIFKRIHRKLELCELSDHDTKAYQLLPKVQKHLLNKYGNSVTYLAYQEETATLSGFIHDCRTMFTAEEIEALGIEGDIDDLQAANLKFNQVYHQRVDEKAAGNTHISVKLRAATDEAYTLLVLTINSLANDPTPGNKVKVDACRAVVGRINIVIKDAKDRLSQRLGSSVAEPGKTDGTATDPTDEEKPDNTAPSENVKPDTPPQTGPSPTDDDEDTVLE